jgi:hypothetical protein
MIPSRPRLDRSTLESVEARSKFICIPYVPKQGGDGTWPEEENLGEESTMKMELERPRSAGGRRSSFNLVQALLKPVHLDEQGGRQATPPPDAMKYALQPAASVRYDTADDGTGYCDIEIFRRNLTQHVFCP